MIQIIKNRTTIYWQWVLNQPTPPREWRVGWVGWRWERSLSASRSGKRSRSRCSRRRTQMRRLDITSKYYCSALKVNPFQQKKEELRVKAAQELADWWGLELSLEWGLNLAIWWYSDYGAVMGFCFNWIRSELNQNCGKELHTLTKPLQCHVIIVQ